VKDYEMDPSFTMPVVSEPPAEPATPPPPLPVLTRATAVTLQPGDLLILETDERVSIEQVTRLTAHLRHVADDETLEVVVLAGARFGALIRPADRPDGLRSGLEWAAARGIKILDPDGWRDDGKPLDELIAEDEFEQRLAQSTAGPWPEAVDGG
jgi:hypothetical protein